MGKGILAKMVRDFTPCFHDKYEWKDLEEKFWEAKKEFEEALRAEEEDWNSCHWIEEWFTKWFGEIK